MNFTWRVVLKVVFWYFHLSLQDGRFPKPHLIACHSILAPSNPAELTYFEINSLTGPSKPESLAGQSEASKSL